MHGVAVQAGFKCGWNVLLGAGSKSNGRWVVGWCSVFCELWSEWWVHVELCHRFGSPASVIVRHGWDE